MRLEVLRSLMVACAALSSRLSWMMEGPLLSEVLEDEHEED